MNEAGKNKAGRCNEPDLKRLVCLGLGSNIEPEINLPHAVELLRRVLLVERISTAWETPAVGAPAPDFLNAALLARVSCSAEVLKYEFIRKVEAHLGRVRSADKNAPRTIDIDILIYDGEILEPQICNQAFLAVPVAELLPNFVCQECGETLLEVAHRLACDTCIEPRPEVLSPSG